jgi:hypothetical protein
MPHTPRHPSRRALPAVIAGLMILAACGSEPGSDAAGTKAARSTTTTSSPATTTEAPTTSAPTTQPVDDTTTTVPGNGTHLPREWVPEQGARAWAVYFGIGSSSTDPAVLAGVARAEGLGYAPEVGDISCDEGASAALMLGDLPEITTRAAVYFASQADAEAVADAADAEQVAVAEITAGCRD